MFSVELLTIKIEPTSIFFNESLNFFINKLDYREILKTIKFL